MPRGGNDAHALVVARPCARGAGRVLDLGGAAMTTTRAGEGRIVRDLHAIAARAALAVADDHVSVKDAQGRFRLGRPTITKAVKALLASRARTAGAR